MRIVSCKFGYILAAVSVMAVLPVLDAHGAVVTFNDAQLEQAVRQEIDKLTGPIYDTDLRGRVQLLAEYREITDLSGLEYMVDLETLQLNNNVIEDLTPLTGLVKLKKLYLNSNYISDLTPLAGLIKLEQLILHTNKITDIEPLVLNTGIGKGDVVRLDYNFIDDNSLCNYIPILTAREVDLTYYGECGDEEVIFPDPQLEEVVRDSFRLQTGQTLGDPIKVAQLQEIDSASEPLFRELYGDHMGIKDLTGLQYCINLQRVFLAGNEIKTISQFSALTQLEEAYLGGNQIPNLKPLEALYSLQRLELQNNKITSLNAIRYLTSITQLALHGNTISDLAPLKNFYSLVLLTLGNQYDSAGKPVLSNISVVQGFKSLIDLDVSGNKIQSLAPIQSLATLQILNISNLHEYDSEGKKVLLLNSLDAVKALTELRILDASNGIISDIGPLAGINNLSYLYLHDNKITNVFALAGLSEIARLNLANNQISSVSPLVANMGIGETDPESELGFLELDHVNLLGNSLSQESLCNDVPTLQRRRVVVDYDGFCCDESQRFLLTTQVRGEGSVDPLGTRQFCSGTTLTLAAKPVAGWRFDHWEGDLTGSENPIEISIISNMRVTAVFGSETERFDLQVFKSGEGNVVLDPEQPAQGYSSGTLVKAKAAPASGWVFDHWEGAALGSAAEVTFTMDADKVLRAFFKKLGPIYKLTTFVNGEGSINPVTGKEHKYPENTLVPVTATPAIGWVFDHWEGALAGTVNPTVLTMNSNKAVTAVFKRDNFDFTLAIVCEGNGATTPVAGYHRYNDGDEETIVAVPSEGWVFDRWTGDVAGVNPTITVKMDTDKTVKAVFILSDTYVLTMAAEGGGTVVPAAGEHIIAEDKKVTLLATADLGWIFDHWTGDIGGNQNPLLVQMTEDLSATAVFRPYPYIDALSPATGYTAGNETIAVNGLNLETATRVVFGDVAGVILSASANQLQVRTPSHARGSVDVVVETALGAISKMAAFTFIDTPEPPQIDSVLPGQGPVIGAVPVTIRGVNVGRATSVTFGGKEVEEIVNSDTNRLLVIPPLLSEIPETLPHAVDVVVTTPFGSDTCAGCYSYVMTPQIASVYPSQAYIAGGDTIYIAGLGLEGTWSVKFDGADATIVSVEENLLQVQAPAHAAGTVDITVTTGIGTGTLEQGFNYYSEAATIVCTAYNTTSKRPVLDATVRIDPQTKIITNSETGTYTFEHVRPGTYQVTVITSYCLPVSQQITVQQNERGLFDAQLQCLPDGPLPCGVNVGKLASGIAEQSMPMSLEQNPDGFVEPQTPIAIRITDPQGIDPATVWTTAEGQTWAGAAASWQEAVPGDASDGWILMTPETPMPVGEVITVTVGANTVNGDAIDPVTLTFAVGPSGFAKSLAVEPQLVAAAADGLLALPALLALDGSAPLRLTPPALYAGPIPIRLPLNDADGKTADLYYYSEAVAHQGWYPAEKVLGLLAGDLRVVEEDGQAYLETSVNHTGIFQLGKKVNVPGHAAAMDIELRGAKRQWFAFAAALLALSITLGLVARPRKIR